MIKIKNIQKSFGDQLVLKDLSKEFEAGNIYALLGRNGAGKTTLLKTMANLFLDYKGEVTFNGENVRVSQRAFNNLVLVNDEIIPPAMMGSRIKELLTYAKILNPDWDEEYKDKLLRVFQIDENKRYTSLSKGYKNLVCLIIGLASSKGALLLDEPYNGLDANNRYKFHQVLIRDVQKNNRPCIISSHIINEIESLLDEVLILEDGKFILDEKIETIQIKSYKLTGDGDKIRPYIKNKNIIREEKLGGFEVFYVFEKLNNKERENISRFAKIEGIDLQTLFILLTEREALNELI